MRRLILEKLVNDPANIVMTGQKGPAMPCPHCHRPNNVVSSDTGAIPKPGDYSVCLHCAGVGEYQKDLSIAKIRIEDVADPEERRALERGVARVKNTASVMLFENDKA